MNKKQAMALPLAALLLAGCAVQAAPSAELPPPAAEATEPPPEPPYTVGTLFRLPYTCGGYWGFNTGDAYYEIARTGPESSGGLILKTDYAAMTQAPVCQVPGCSHDSEACPAYLPSWSRIGLFVLDGTVYLQYGGFPRREREQMLSDEEFEAWLAEGSITGGQEAAVRADRALSLQPGFVEKIEPDGQSRRRVATLPDDFEWEVSFTYCDGQALYGCNSYSQENALLRWDLATGKVDSIELLPTESVIGASGSRFLIQRTVTDEPLGSLSETQNAAALRNAEIEFDLLDPAVGTRQKLFSRPYNQVLGDGCGYIGSYNGRYCFIFLSTDTNCNVKENRIEAYDPATGKTAVLLNPLPNPNAWPDLLDGGFMPVGGGRQRSMMPITAYGNTSSGDRAWLLDLDTGALHELTQRQYRDGCYQPVSLMAQTNDGRWLVGYRPHSETHNDRCDYGLIDPQAFLQGSQDYALAAMYNG